MFVALTALLALASVGRAPAPAARCGHLPPPPVRVARANDNRARAGTLRDGVLEVRLVARAAAWRPDGPDGCALGVHAFAEEGASVQIPGPLIRVRAGTTVHVQLRNALAAPLWVRGLQSRRPGVVDSLEIAPGASRAFAFVADAPGAWYYWAGTADARIPASSADGQLVGALVVDPADAPRAEDRILVLTRWTPTATPGNAGYQLNAFNGRAWPNTERMTYTAGDSVHWHVINASDGTHEMHLHGFYFRLERRGYVLADTAVPTRAAGRMQVTAVLRPGEWLSMSWSPDRPGNWLYHCHILTHMSGAQRLDRMPEAIAATAEHEHAPPSAHGVHDMGGLVLGLDVRPSRVAGARGARDSASAAARTFDLFASARARTFGERTGYGFVVQEGPRPPAADSIRIPGTPLVVTRGEPVRITVHNRLAFPIAVHWHGIELDSYFDGVGGFSGAARRIAPMIAPDDSFVVRFTPPRAGTFMYHVHGERGEELASGLYAPLLVLEPGAAYDPRTDRVIVLADGGPGADRPLVMNGSATPDTMQLVVGTTYRLRMIFITANDVVFSTLSGPGAPVARLLAFDGHDVAAGGGVAQPLRQPTGPGHTFDVAFTPVTAGDYSLAVDRTLGGQRFGPVTTMPVRVRAP